MGHCFVFIFDFVSYNLLAVSVYGILPLCSCIAIQINFLIFSMMIVAINFIEFCSYYFKFIISIFKKITKNDFFKQIISNRINIYQVKIFLHFNFE